MNKKGQAALEFLTTYGWAFLVILIVIGALAYFGILSPSKFLPNRCNFGSEFTCEDYQISATAGTVALKLKNGAGKPIVVDSMTLGNEGSNGLSCTYPGTNGTLRPWKSSNITDFTWACSNMAAAGFAQGEKGKVLITIRYYDIASGSSYVQEAKGEIFAAVI